MSCGVHGIRPIKPGRELGGRWTVSALWLLFLVASAFFGAPSQAQAQRANGSEQTFFPMNPGNRWVFTYSDIRDSSPLTQHVISELAGPVEVRGSVYRTPVGDNTLPFLWYAFLLCPASCKGELFVEYDIATNRVTARKGEQSRLLLDFDLAVGDTLELGKNLNHNARYVQRTTGRGWIEMVGVLREYVELEIFDTNFTHFMTYRFVKGVGLTQYIGAQSNSVRGTVLSSVKINGDMMLSSPVPKTDAEVAIPKAFQIVSAYPNPFNPATNIQFTVDMPQNITLRIYDLLGRQISSTSLGMVSPGTYLQEINLESQSSGIYIVRLMGDHEVVSTRVTLLK